MERWLSYKGTCHIILLAKLHDMYRYKTATFHINHKSESQRWFSYTDFTVLRSFLCIVCVRVCISIIHFSCFLFILICFVFFSLANFNNKTDD